MSTPSADLRTGASIAATTPTSNPSFTVTRGDIVGPARRQSVVDIESPAGRTNRLVFPSNLGPHYMNIGISRIRRTSLQNSLVPFTNNIRESETSIALPLPENIQDVTRVAYSESPVLGGVNALNAILSGVSSAINVQPSQQSAIQRGLIGFGRQIQEPAVNEVIARTGTTPNQMLTVLLQGPTYKTHSFTWKLYPTNSRESAVIREIIKELKIKSRPGTTIKRQFFTFPRVFNLSFTINGTELFDEFNQNNYLFAFKPAVLEGISVNFTPSGQPALYKGVGAPDGVELTLNFKEIEYWLNGDEPFFSGNKSIGDFAFGVSTSAIGAAQQREFNTDNLADRVSGFISSFGQRN